MKISRRAFLASAAAPLFGADPIIDIHQHTTYLDRTDDDLVAHQRALGVTKTILLPAGRRYGLAARASGNDSVVALARRFPKEFVFFANELPDIPEAKSVITQYLKAGAIGIGEQKFPVEADSPHIELVATIAQEFRVPVLLHFEHGNYNLNFARFHRILEKFPRVNFIGHAQTWWGNIDKNHDQTVMYPKTKVTPGGITDRLLADYPNMYADMSAGSGLNAMLRDEDHARGFLERHQNKLLYGSDCADNAPNTDKCSGSKQIATIRRLAPSRKIERKILYENAAKLMRIS
jgi:predicted TIM-barrel fold metal-dependent hydrolase